MFGKPFQILPQPNFRPKPGKELPKYPNKSEKIDNKYVFYRSFSLLFAEVTNNEQTFDNN